MRLRLFFHLKKNIYILEKNYIFSKKKLYILLKLTTAFLYLQYYI